MLTEARVSLRRLVFVAIFLAPGQIIFAQNFTGQVYSLGDRFVNYDCEVVYSELPICDCCGSALAFLTKNTFAMVSQCEYGDTFYAGSYEATSTKVTLTYKQLAVSEILNDDNSFREYEKKEADLESDRFEIEVCQGVFVLKNPSNHNLKLGTRLEKADESALLKELTASKALLLFD